MDLLKLNRIIIESRSIKIEDADLLKIVDYLVSQLDSHRSLDKLYKKIKKERQLEFSDVS